MKLKAIFEARLLTSNATLAEAVNTDPIINKMVIALNAAGVTCQKADVSAIFVGGDSKGAKKFLEAICKKLNYNDAATSYKENEAFFIQCGVTKAEYNRLVKASQ